MKLSIVVPAYNEEATIAELIEKVKKVQLDKEIVIVDDGSTDSTPKILESINGIKVITKPNGGKGSAIIEGIRHVTGEVVVIQDADLEYDPEDFKVMLETMIENNADVVYGSRLLHSDYKVSYRRFFWGGKLVTAVANILYGISISDEPTCYKMIKTDLLKSLNLQCRRFEFCPEVTAKIAKREIKIVEVPISYFPRSIEEGKKIGARDGIEAIWTLLRYKFTK